MFLFLHRLFKSEGRGPSFGPIANIGDIIGCGILFPSIDIQENSEVEVFFTMNGEKVIFIMHHDQLP